MNAPIVEFCQNYADNRAIRLHMPGHKGLLSPTDITEVDGADSLYVPNGIIRESMKNATKLFGTKRTYYSTEGSSQAIKAMVYLASVMAKGENKYILAGRNAHKSFISACALLDVGVEWLGFDGLLTANVTTEQVDLFLQNASQKPIAVFITTPDYLGNMLNVKQIASVCKKHGVLLLCDNAHGSYLKFCSRLHPISQGADMCADSAHKTLFALTGAAYLHVGKTCPSAVCAEAENALSLFGSTSPNYLILQSLDALNVMISQNQVDFNGLVKNVKNLKNRLIGAHFTLVGTEIAKITICAKPFGYTGFELYAHLKAHGIVCEFCDEDYLVMMFSAHNDESDFNAVYNALAMLEKRKRITKSCPKLEKPTVVMQPGVAIKQPKEWVSVDKSCGRVLAGAVVSCPPAVLVVSLGERISQNAIKVLKYYKIRKVLVVKN